MLWLQFLFGVAEYRGPLSQKCTNWWLVATQKCSSAYNTNGSIDLQIEGNLLSRGLLPLPSLSPTERRILRRDINGRSPRSNYSTACSTRQQRRWEKKERCIGLYLPRFCLTEQLLQPLFLSPSNCLGNNQSGVAEAWRREMYRGGVVGNYKRNQFDEFPSSREEKKKRSINQADGRSKTTTF